MILLPPPTSFSNSYPHLSTTYLLFPNVFPISTVFSHHPIFLQYLIPSHSLFIKHFHLSPTIHHYSPPPNYFPTIPSLLYLFQPTPSQLPKPTQLKIAFVLYSYVFDGKPPELKSGEVK